MTIRIQLFSHLRDAAGVADLDLQVTNGATVSDLLAQLYERTPALRAWDNSILIGVGVEFVGLDHLLRGDEEIAIMPPVQGG